MKLGSRCTAVIFPGVRRLRPPRTVDLANGPGPASPSSQELPDHPQNDPPRAAWPPGSPVEQPDAKAFKAWLAPLRRCEWVVYAKRPFAGPQAVLAYLSRYTHRVAISNSRLIALDKHGVTFKWKDYRVKNGSKRRTRHKTMTLEPGEFMRRFLLHVLPGGLHRIRHYGLLANGSRKASLNLAREFLNIPAVAAMPANGGDLTIPPPTFVCWHCGCAMVILQTLTRGHGPAIRAPPSSQTR